MYSLYRHYDDASALLYVGFSANPLGRLSQHNASSHWASRIASIKVERFSDVDDALQAEKLAIEVERPLYNVPGDRRAAPPRRKANGRLVTVTVPPELCGVVDDYREKVQVECGAAPPTFTEVVAMAADAGLDQIRELVGHAVGKGLLNARFGNPKNPKI